MHIFGVDQGTCPPGTYLKTAPGSGTSNVSLGGNLTAGAPARLRDLHLLTFGGQSIELSTQFEPNTTVYGAMVPTVGLRPTIVLPILQLVSVPNAGSEASDVHHCCWLLADGLQRLLDCTCTLWRRFPQSV